MYWPHNISPKLCKNNTNCKCIHMSPSSHVLSNISTSNHTSVMKNTTQRVFPCMSLPGKCEIFFVAGLIWFLVRGHRCFTLVFDPSVSKPCRSSIFMPSHSLSLPLQVLICSSFLWCAWNNWHSWGETPVSNNSKEISHSLVEIKKPLNEIRSCLKGWIWA